MTDPEILFGEAVIVASCYWLIKETYHAYKNKKQEREANKKHQDFFTHLHRSIPDTYQRTSAKNNNKISQTNLAPPPASSYRSTPPKKHL